MMKIKNLLRGVAVALCVVTGLSAVAKTNSTDNTKISGTWYASGLYSFNIANNGYTYSRIGAMGGYLGNWGGYLKCDFALNGNRTPNVCGGFTKRLATFSDRTSSRKSALYIYFGLGHGCVEHKSEIPDHDHIYHPDGSFECVPGTDRTESYWDSLSGMLADTGLIYRYRHLNFNLGYSISADIIGAAFSSGQSANHSIQLGIGYTF